MKRTLIQPAPEDYPEVFRPLLSGCRVYDSSCSDTARVIYIDRDGGLFLKSAPQNSLRDEVDMTRWFGSRGLAARVLDYVSDQRDWLLTTRVPGEDCLYAEYLSQPERLCDTLGGLLRALHDMKPTDCPAKERLTGYLAPIEANRRAGVCHRSHLGKWGFDTPEQAWNIVCSRQHILSADTLTHGDFCLPNIMLDDWHFTGFIDLGQSGLSDRHIDLYWCMWSLNYNLKTDRYNSRFLDAYGRDAVDAERLQLVAAVEVFG